LEDARRSAGGPLRVGRRGRGCRNVRLAATISTWEDEVLAYWTTGKLSNVRTEAMNLNIKAVKRAARGFRNFRHYRLQLLLRCGVQCAHSTHRPSAKPPAPDRCVEPRKWGKRSAGWSRAIGRAGARAVRVQVMPDCYFAVIA
ncbi:MAG: transposase, partial [Actinomycetota bacterium]|nr:transposase [Actinomycetota bacterium]